MWRTTKGIRLLRRIANKKRWWQAYGSTGILLCFIMMILMTFVLIWQAWVVSGFTAEQREALPGPEVALVLPGINPILPLEYLGYILLGLVVAIVIHEFSHGIITQVHNYAVKSLGILYLIVPIGAFVEPDEEQVKKAKIKARMRIYAAGPTANFVMVVVAMLLFVGCMAAVQPAAEGVSILFVSEGAPAEESMLTPGTIITEINGTKVQNQSVFYALMQTTTANQTITIDYVRSNTPGSVRVMLADKSVFSKNVSDAGKGYLGVGTSEAHTVFLRLLQNPFMAFPDGFFIFYSLPLWGYFQGNNPIAAPFTDAYTLSGVFGFLPAPVFWVLVNAIYWIFWLNLAVALFNVLPMVPLDGGYLFNDGVKAVVQRVKKGSTEEQRERIVKNISVTLSFLILILIIFPWLIKYI
ncbi:MAG: site-2 protease family protein [Candidatus Thermoplasmatota archaeon]|nr:site-2 protease family protein [Candidatus Thermoplasmatota archaeon]